MSNVFLNNRKQKKNVQRLTFLVSVETDSDSDGATDSDYVCSCINYTPATLFSKSIIVFVIFVINAVRTI